ncbi:uncharacterized protein LOC118750006 [Rhagoletis pomonella]|uniref:uncharacterized protein LOC118750006 n=1 Tax=Rhagoletis pomonella TaxID=28610 RepID=UPI00177C9044|nr:uncharacterized protein LOC118750006 [Rhagoletis pomonella]
MDLNRQCDCPSASIVPTAVNDFLYDQCGPRLLSLDSGLDHTRTDNCSLECNVENHTETAASSIGYVPSSSEDDEASEEVTQSLKVSDLSLKNYCSALDRTDTSDRFGSLLATMLIKDLQAAIATKVKKDFKENTADKIMKYFDYLVIDKNKISRERNKCRAQTEAATKTGTDLKCISYDGKQDVTLKKKIVHGSVRTMLLREEHITILKEPDSKFIGYVSPKEGTGEAIQQAIVSFLNTQKYCLNELVAISCDGTAVNTGYKIGVNAQMERYLQRPLQWNVCLLHFNELPLKKLLTHYIGKQKGPGVWPGVLGSEIMTCTKYPVVSGFEAIAMGVIPENIGSWELRNDQRYLFDMVLAVNNGECDEYLASKSPGPVSTARWLTTASRLLRVYVSKESPSAELRNMVEFVVKVYAPFWFLVKSQPQAIHGSRHVFKYICWIRELSNAVQAIIRSAIENNAYYFHPENILLAMITDADPEIRNDGYEKIKTARQYPPAGLRVFKVPKRGVINFESKSYVSMIDWSQFKITEPPCVQFYPDSELTMFQFSENEVINIPEFLCHSQNTERFVRVVSESASAVTDEKRLGHIFAKLESRDQYKSLDSRQNLLK